MPAAPTRQLGWVLCGAGELPRDDAWLSARERAVLAGLAPGQRRQGYRLGRFTAKRALARWLGLSEASEAFAGLEVLAAGDGTPEPLWDGEPSVASLSLSHRASLAIAAVGPSGLALGCDLELVEPRGDRFLSDFYRPEELDLVRGAASRDRELLATVIWSAKESALKARHQALGGDVRDVAIRLCEGDELTPWRGFVARFPDRSDLCGLWRPLGNSVVTVASAEPFEPRPLARRDA